MKTGIRVIGMNTDGDAWLDAAPFSMHTSIYNISLAPSEYPYILTDFRPSTKTFTGMGEQG
jgi:hypothetical protein